MIEKERLEELIKQGATIYWLNGKNIEKTKLKHKYHKFFVNDDYNVEILYEYNEKLCMGIWKHKISKLFETKEEAEWFQEFGCIERTEKLELPTWEQIKSCIANHDSYVEIKFTNKDKNECNLCVEFYEDKITVNGIGGCYNIWNLTKENYFKACKLAKELFLGEKN